MSVGREYRRKTETARALQWRGDNAEEMAKFVGGEITTLGHKDGLLVLNGGTQANSRVAKLWDYVIRNPSGSLMVLEEDLFRFVYEPCDTNEGCQGQEQSLIAELFESLSCALRWIEQNTGIDRHETEPWYWRSKSVLARVFHKMRKGEDKP